MRLQPTPGGFIQQPQQALGPSGYIQQQPQQGIGHWVYIQQPQQGIGAFGVEYPDQPQLAFAQQPQLAYAQQPQQAFAQQPQQAFVQQPQQELGQPGSARQLQPGIAQQMAQPQQGTGQWVYLQQPQQAFNPQPQQLQQGMARVERVEFVQPGEAAFAQPQPQVRYVQQQPQQDIGQWVYVQAPLQGFGLPVQPLQPGGGLAGYAPQQPQQYFGAQGGQMAGSYETYPAPGRGQPDLQRARRGLKNYTRSDERMRELICERLIQDLSIDASDVSIEVASGRVTMSGTVPNRQMRHAIEDAVDGCWGVQDIVNDIHVQTADTTTMGAGRGLGQPTTAQAGGGFAAAGSTLGGKTLAS